MNTVERINAIEVMMRVLEHKDASPEVKIIAGKYLFELISEVTQ